MKLSVSPGKRNRKTKGWNVEKKRIVMVGNMHR